jgi:hypothetical protein
MNRTEAKRLAKMIDVEVAFGWDDPPVVPDVPSLLDMVA